MTITIKLVKSVKSIIVLALIELNITACTCYIWKLFNECILNIL
jgi:hypothetical protein